MYSIKIFWIFFPRSPWSNTDSSRIHFSDTGMCFWYQCRTLLVRKRRFSFPVLLLGCAGPEFSVRQIAWLDLLSSFCFTAVIFFTLSCGEIGTQFRMFSFPKEHQLSPIFHASSGWKRWIFEISLGILKKVLWLFFSFKNVMFSKLIWTYFAWHRTWFCLDCSF